MCYEGLASDIDMSLGEITVTIDEYNKRMAEDIYCRKETGRTDSKIVHSCLERDLSGTPLYAFSVFMPGEKNTITAHFATDTKELIPAITTMIESMTFGDYK